MAIYMPVDPEENSKSLGVPTYGYSCSEDKAGASGRSQESSVPSVNVITSYVWGDTGFHVTM